MSSEESEDNLPIHENYACNVAILAHSIHYLRRICETLFVHRFSSATFAVRHIPKVRWKISFVNFFTSFIFLVLSLLRFLHCLDGLRYQPPWLPSSFWPTSFCCIFIFCYRWTRCFEEKSKIFNINHIFSYHENYKGSF